MVSKRRKKYQSGEGARYVSRKAALRMLQLTLKDFRRLCILKGIYPREPRNRKRAQKGASGIKTLYHLKDIQFLMHEPIIWKLRDYKIFARKMGRARALRDFESMKRYLANHPNLTLDHIVKERYPSFIDALRDLDDALTLLFLFSTFPSLRHVPRDQSALCRRLSMEFLHAVIAAKALRKVFISIKGYYYQAEIKGQTITWIVPHYFSFVPHTTQEVDFKVMSHFVEFYCVMVGFVNYRLYHSLNLHYPPKFAVSSADANEKMLADEEVFVSERIASLNAPLIRTGGEPEEEEEAVMDEFPTEGGDPEKLEEAKKEAEKVKKLKTLFKGLKFFINREVPREPMVFIIRCFGGEVSWDKKLFVGATFNESDEGITHQIIDRPTLEKQYISRYYVQPQWVFDSVNARELLPVEKYFIGVVLPPHLSPFVDKTRQRYIPPEEKELEDPTLREKTGEEEEKESEESEQEEEEKEEEAAKSDDTEDEEGSEQKAEEELEKQTATTEDNEPEKIREQKKKKMSVSIGTIAQESAEEKRQQMKQEHKLREKMVKKKHIRLYKSMMKGRYERSKEAWLLSKKRKLLEEQQKVNKKGKKLKISNVTTNEANG